MSKNPLHSVELVDNATMPSIGKLCGNMSSMLGDDEYELQFDTELQCVIARLRDEAKFEAYRAAEKARGEVVEMQTRLYPISYVRSMVPAIGGAAKKAEKGA